MLRKDKKENPANKSSNHHSKFFSRVLKRVESHFKSVQGKEFLALINDTEKENKREEKNLHTVVFDANLKPQDSPYEKAEEIYEKIEMVTEPIQALFDKPPSLPPSVTETSKAAINLVQKSLSDHDTFRNVVKAYRTPSDPYTWSNFRACLSPPTVEDAIGDITGEMSSQVKSFVCHVIVTAVLGSIFEKYSVDENDINDNKTLPKKKVRKH